MAQRNKGGDHDLESGRAQPDQLYPNMMETPQFRWAFIRKVYSIISFQLLLTVVCAAVIVNIPSLPNWIRHTTGGAVLFIVVLVCSIINIILLFIFHKKHPWNYLLLTLFTIFTSITVGVCCAFKPGKIVLLAVILTAAMVVGLTLYTFWAVKRGQDFGFMGPFLFAASIMLLIFALIQILIPLGPIGRTIYAALGALLSCAYIVYDTDNIIKRYSYDEYIIGAIAIYMDIIQLFVFILSLLGGDN